MSPTPLTRGDDDALTYEQTHVHLVYESIASHFSSTRYKPWPVVDSFLRDLRPGSIGLDVGCGNGKYLNVNKDVFIIGSDRSSNLIALAAQHQTSQPQAAAGSHSAEINRTNFNADVLIADTLSIPHPPHSFDFAICIAVIHHLSSRQRRIAAIQGILQILKVGNNAQPDCPSQQQGHPRTLPEGENGASEQGFPATRSVNSIANENSGTDAPVSRGVRESSGAAAIRLEESTAIGLGEEFTRRRCVENVTGGEAERSPRLDGGQDGGIADASQLPGGVIVDSVADEGPEERDANALDRMSQRHDVASDASTKVARQQETERDRSADSTPNEPVVRVENQTQTQYLYQDTADDQPSLHELPFRGTSGKSNAATTRAEGGEQVTSSSSKSTAGAHVHGDPGKAPRAGQALLFVWALEQQGSRRGWKEGDQQDVLVPWVLKSQSELHGKGKGKKGKGVGGKRGVKVRRRGEGEQDGGAAGKGDGTVRNEEGKGAGDGKGEIHTAEHGDGGGLTQEGETQTATPHGQEQKGDDAKEQVFGRYYHLYAQGELEAECEEAGAKVVRQGYDRDNWWVVIEPAC